MIFGVSHVVLPTTDLARARLFYVDRLGFPTIFEDSEILELDAGGFAIRLSPAKTSIAPVEFWLQVGDLDEALAHIAMAGGEVVELPIRGAGAEVVAEARDPDGHRLRLWRRLSEDELEAPPDLPTTVTWSAEADELMKSLLMSIPALFRKSARQSAVLATENLLDGERLVRIPHVVRGYIRATPRIMRGRARKTVAEHGFRPEDFTSDFEA